MAGKKERRVSKTPKGQRHQHPHRGGVMRYVYLAASGITKGCLVLCTLAGTLVGTVQAGERRTLHNSRCCFDARFDFRARSASSSSFRRRCPIRTKRDPDGTSGEDQGNIGRCPLRCSRRAPCTGGALGARSVSRHRARAVPPSGPLLSPAPQLTPRPARQNCDSEKFCPIASLRSS